MRLMLGWPTKLEMCLNHRGPTARGYNALGRQRDVLHGFKSVATPSSQPMEECCALKCYLHHSQIKIDMPFFLSPIKRVAN